MGSVIQDMPRINHRSQPCWDRFERADLFAQYREFRSQGLSERQAANELKVPRTTLPAWRRWHDTLATQQLERLQSDPHSTGTESAKHRPGRPPKEPVSLEQAEQALAVARREHARFCEQRQQVKASLCGIGHVYHFVDLERGVRRNGPLIASDIQGHIEQIHTIAQHDTLSQSCLERIDKARQVVPTMPATIEFVSRYVAQQIEQLDVTPPISFAMHAKLIPSYYLDRVAEKRTVSEGEPFRELAERLRAPLVEPGGVLWQLSPEVQEQLQKEAKGLAGVFQRSSSNVEGRNGSIALRNHQLRRLDLPRKRACFTAIHNFFLTRPDGTTAAERFFGQKPRSMVAAILDSVALAPAPLSPPRKA